VASNRVGALRQLLPVLHSSSSALPRSFDEIRRSLGTAPVLVYGLGLRTAWLFIIDKGQLLARSLGDRDSLARLVDHVLAHPDDPVAAGELGARLMPAGALPSPTGVIQIVPTGVLRRVSFAALRNNDRLLIQDFDVAYAPSLTVSSLPHASEPRRDPPVVLADSRGDLAGAAREAADVGALLGVAPKLGAAASIAQLRQARNALVLHVAVHAGIAADGAFLSLADGDVRGTEILDWGIHPNLVVLAGCGSSSSRDDERWGALSSLFLAAGSRFVVGTLRSVDDDRAEIVMQSFYRNGGSSNPVRGLARAQRELALIAPPSAWSAFVVLEGAAD
jgi:hypothetical protein